MSDPQSMFVRYFLDMPLPFEVAEHAIVNGAERWVPGVARDARGRGERLLVEVGFGPPSHRLEKRVEIELGPSLQYPSKTIVPMSWKATGPEALFPSLEGDIEVAPLGPARTQLSITARYRPPLGRIGKLVDRALLHRVAESTIKDFLDRAAETLMETVAAKAS